MKNKYTYRTYRKKSNKTKKRKKIKIKSKKMSGGFGFGAVPGPGHGTPLSLSLSDPFGARLPGFGTPGFGTSGFGAAPGAPGATFGFGAAASPGATGFGAVPGATGATFGFGAAASPGATFGATAADASPGPGLAAAHGFGAADDADDADDAAADDADDDKLYQEMTPREKRDYYRASLLENYNAQLGIQTNLTNKIEKFDPNNHLSIILQKIHLFSHMFEKLVLPDLVHKYSGIKPKNKNYYKVSKKMPSQLTNTNGYIGYLYSQTHNDRLLNKYKKKLMNELLTSAYVLYVISNPTLIYQSTGGYRITSGLIRILVKSVSRINHSLQRRIDRVKIDPKFVARFVHTGGNIIVSFAGFLHYCVYSTMVRDDYLRVFNDKMKEMYEGTGRDYKVIADLLSSLTNTNTERVKSILQRINEHGFEYTNFYDFLSDIALSPGDLDFILMPNILDDSWLVPETSKRLRDWYFSVSAYIIKDAILYSRNPIHVKELSSMDVFTEDLKHDIEYNYFINAPPVDTADLSPFEFVTQKRGMYSIDNSDFKGPDKSIYVAEELPKMRGFRHIELYIQDIDIRLQRLKVSLFNRPDRTMIELPGNLNSCKCEAIDLVIPNIEGISVKASLYKDFKIGEVLLYDINKSLESSPNKQKKRLLRKIFLEIIRDFEDSTVSLPILLESFYKIISGIEN